MRWPGNPAIRGGLAGVLLSLVVACSDSTGPDNLVVEDPPELWQGCQETIVPTVEDGEITGRSGLVCKIEVFFEGATRADWEDYKEANGISP